MAAIFKIKICGITSPADGLAAAEAGADAIGLNFYPPSPRFVSFQRAAAIGDELPPKIKKVGLFVNAPVDQMLQAYQELKLDLLQLHGDESTLTIKKLGKCPVLKVFRLTGEEGWQTISGFLMECDRLGCMPEMVLLDAAKSESYGGTGKLADWALAKRYCAANIGPALALAGGLAPANVGEAIAATGVLAVDTASGVESAPGTKDSAAIRAFVLAARKAFALNLHPNRSDLPNN